MLLSLVKFFLIFVEIVTSSPLGHQIFWLRSIRFNFFAESSDVNIHSSCISGIIISPNEIKKVIAAISFCANKLPQARDVCLAARDVLATRACFHHTAVRQRLVSFGVLGAGVPKTCGS